MQDHYDIVSEIDIDKNNLDRIIEFISGLRVPAQKRAISRLPSVKKSLNHTDKRETIWRIRMRLMLLTMRKPHAHGVPKCVLCLSIVLYTAIW